MINIQLDEEARLPEPLPLSLELIERAVNETMRCEEITTECELTIVLSDDAHLQRLNAEFMGIEAPTDVLSFPTDMLLDPDTGQPYLGDVIISVERAIAQAPENGQTPRAEMLLLVVHGVLHLLGHDHAEEQDKAMMWAAQAQILEKLQGA